MGTVIDWGMLRNAPDVGAAFQAGQDKGKVQSALGTVARDPANIDALANLTSIAPEQAYRFQEAHRTQATFDRGERFRGAYSNYLAPAGSPQPNALAGIGQPVTGGVLNRNPATPNMTLFNTPSGPRSPDSHLATDVPGSLGAFAENQGLPDDIVVQGRRPAPIPRVPVAPGGAGWDEVVRADPVEAVKAQHDMYGAREDHLKDWQHVSQAGMRLLGSVRDQDSWERGVTTARHLYDTYGVPFPENLPDEYSPEVVRDLQMGQLNLEDQIAAALRERKFEWQRDDDEIDNARADRNTNSIISDRDARRGLTARGQNLTDSRGRYGISVASADRRRGQDIQRDRPSRAGGAASAGTKLTRIAVGADGKKIGWNGKAWVPAQ